MSKRDKGRIEGQFVAMRYEIMDCPAYIATSHGARSLLRHLSGGCPGNDRAYLSFTGWHDRELKAGFGFYKVKEWFAELQHYGFIVLAVHGSLGADGRGRAPHWRLTQLGHVARRWNRVSNEGISSLGRSAL